MNQASAPASVTGAANQYKSIGLEVQNLRVEYGDCVAVADTSFAVQAGDSFGIVGESGSGKSTVLRAICGLAASNGRVQLLWPLASTLPAPA